MFLGASFPTARFPTVDGPSTGVPLAGVFWVFWFLGPLGSYLVFLLISTGYACGFHRGYAS